MLTLAQNAGNRDSKDLIFKHFRGRILPDRPNNKGARLRRYLLSNPFCEILDPPRLNPHFSTIRKTSLFHFVHRNLIKDSGCQNPLQKNMALT